MIVLVIKTKFKQKIFLSLHISNSRFAASFRGISHWALVPQLSCSSLLQSARNTCACNVEELNQGQSKQANLRLQ